VQRTDALLADRDAKRFLPACSLDPGNGQRIDKTACVNAAVRHIARSGVTRQIVKFVHVEGARENPTQQTVGGEQFVAGRIDHRANPSRVDSPCLFQNGSNLWSFDDATAGAFMRDNRRS
jgi:hypothetical protein